MPDNSVVRGEVDALTRRVEAVEDRVETLQIQTNGNFAAVIEGQAALRREMRDGFAKVDTRLDEFGNRLDRLETRFDEFGNRLDEFGNRLDRVEIRLDEFGNRLDRVEIRLDEFGNRLGGIEQKLDRNQAQIVELLGHLVGRDPDGR
ncbi:hypothetical protein ABZ714_02280 [Streptomyces sp. NPDC006798]|uniref:hypothetical protein n=1 Tax=Streptomyces sp. NPDC006798 TaxID=3155462 RepID=UPI0033F4AD2C